MRVCLCLLALAAFSLHAATPPKNETVHGKLVVRSGEAPVIETAEHKRIVLDGDQPTRKVLNDKRVNGFEVEARGHFTAPDQFLIDPQHTRALVVLPGRQAQNDHLLVRRLLHSRVRARAVRVLPEGNRPRPARPGRYSDERYSATRTRSTGSRPCSWPTPRTRWKWRLPRGGQHGLRVKVGGAELPLLPVLRARRRCGQAAVVRCALPGAVGQPSGRRYVLGNGKRYR